VPLLALQERSDRVIEELKVELALVRRDLIQRLNHIEEYMSFLESDVSRLRLDFQRFNDKMQEFTEKPISYNIRATAPLEHPSITPEVKTIRSDLEATTAAQIQPATSTVQQQQVIKSLDKKEGLNQTEVTIIKYLIDNPGTKSATPIAQSIGKAREHVARTLKKLADEKKIIRDETTWPYTYVVPEDVKNIVNQFSSSSQSNPT
jgi:predicted transcriptional regulator